MSERDDRRDRPESERFKRLPEPIRLEDTIETYDTSVARDPDGGRDPEQDFMLRHAGF
jgi:hypothetical protein